MNSGREPGRVSEASPYGAADVLVAHVGGGFLRLSSVRKDARRVRLERQARIGGTGGEDPCVLCARITKDLLEESALSTVVFVWADGEPADPPLNRWIEAVSTSRSGLRVRSLDELLAVAHAFVHRTNRTLIVRFGETIQKAGFASNDGMIQALSMEDPEEPGGHRRLGDYSEAGLGRFVRESLAGFDGIRRSRLVDVAGGRGEAVSYEMVCDAIELYGDTMAQRVLEEFLEPLAIHLRRQCRRGAIAQVVITGDLVAEHLACIKNVLAKKNAPFGDWEYTAVQLERGVAIGAGFFAGRDRGHPGVSLDKVGADSVLRLAADRPIEYWVRQTHVPCFSDDCDVLPEVVGSRPILAVVDGNVERIYGKRIRAYLRERVNVVGYLELSVSERVKDLGTVEHICAKAKDLEFRRDGVFVGIGGGVLLDIVGFAASVFRRGVAFVRIPTTLVGLVDVGMGIKQGINFCKTKNLIGSFYPPMATINDRRFVATLGEREIRCGFAETLKMALIRNQKLFSLLERNAMELVDSRFERPPDVAEEVMMVASRDMMEELQPNLFEDDLERLVDFGHTFSPTIELHTEYAIAHGEAVAMDIYLSCLLAVDRRALSVKDLNRVQRLYQKAGLKTWATCCPTEEQLYDGLRDVKSHRGGRLNLVVPAEIGKGVFLLDVKYREIAMAAGIAREESERAEAERGPENVS
jgi:3-dehydroquinate synthase